ncbi:hypothetical protein CRE_04796 [Caenorhabditis remanei]|uniref:Uncharacterized protein n=1 Tax=Caenorhabditis remanei TaxID=31234 RepID=E3LZA6_CAERE|nr:hypothetical protein CRE_04796 [Caenorhabditis remanei]
MSVSSLSTYPQMNVETFASFRRIKIIETKEKLGADEVCSEAEFAPNHTDNWPFGETRQSAKKKKINMNQEETGNAQRQGIKNRKRKEEMIVVMSQKKGKEMGNWAKIHNNKNGEI